MPPLRAVLADGSLWSTQALVPQTLSLVAIFRGGWCADCRRFVSRLDERLAELQALGIEAVAASVDDAEATTRTRDEWGIGRLLLAGGLDRDEARSWGLYASQLTMQGAQRFCLEPGLFLLRPDHTLYALWLQTLPSARPDVDWLVETLGYLSSHGFPLRGAD